MNNNNNNNNNKKKIIILHICASKLIKIKGAGSIEISPEGHVGCEWH